MVDVLVRPRNMRAFLSSTFKDLKFERRFVIKKLKTLGFDVVSMEADYKTEFDWQRWSINQAAQCDLFIFMFGNRIGTQGQKVLDLFISISELERRQARGSAIRLLEYRLERPFPDQETLFTPEERDEYLDTIAAEDDHRHTLERLIARTLQEGRGTLIESIADLERRLEVDTRVSWANYFLHKMRVFYRSYFDKNYCAWHRAFEDECLIDSTDRFLSWRLRRLVPLFLILFVVPLAVLFYELPFTIALFCGTMLLMFVGGMILAYRPSFVWVGTKTIMARGLFGRLVQRSTKEAFQLKAHWATLNDWTGLGALSVHFADGARVFVPLVIDPDAFVRKINSKIKER